MESNYFCCLQNIKCVLIGTRRIVDILALTGESGCCFVKNVPKQGIIIVVANKLSDVASLTLQI